MGYPHDSTQTQINFGRIMKKVSVISNVLSIAAIIFLFILDYPFMSVGYIIKNVLILALILLSILIYVRKKQTENK